jgi:hypothetical protein
VRRYTSQFDSFGIMSVDEMIGNFLRSFGEIRRRIHIDLLNQSSKEFVGNVAFVGS